MQHVEVFHLWTEPDRPSSSPPSSTTSTPPPPRPPSPPRKRSSERRSSSVDSSSLFSPRNRPVREQLAAQATEGHPITQPEASTIAHAESDVTRRGPIKGGPAATAQSLHDRQQNFLEVAGNIARKPSAKVTVEDAKKVQHFESRALGHPPGKNSLSAEVQSLADRNAQNDTTNN
ncbi:hypothetical protein VTH82DRAFT_5396 [Thermothelomyces myriococcoides]